MMLELQAAELNAPPAVLDAVILPIAKAVRDASSSYSERYQRMTTKPQNIDAWLTPNAVGLVR